MSTGTEVIERALSYIGAHSPLNTANPESVNTGMEVLNSFIAGLQDDGVDMGAVPLKFPGDELSEPLGARNAIEYNLAVLLLPLFPGAKISLEFKKEARLLLRDLKARWKPVIVPNRQVRGTLPKGQGNRRSGTFFKEGGEGG